MAQHNVELTLKRALDILVSAMALILLSLPLALIALAVKITSRGPVLYRWHVVGKGGRPFVSYKFRTMVVGADQMRENLRGESEMSGPFFKMKSDPRVTPIGRILRKFSLDELPQLWSVLKGDMSLVGPRPTQVFEYAQLEDWHKRRATVRPGGICLWHVRGKTKDFDEMVRLDLEYIDNWSLWLDISVLARAVPYVLLGSNY
jgi:lipopolysaccharide/colanic/teichoic acid biosynthesis glycosyltransferase